MKSAVVLAAALAVSVAAPAVAQPRPETPPAAAPSERLLPVSQLFPYLDRYLALQPAQRSRFRLDYLFQLNGRPFTGRAWYVSRTGQRTPITVEGGRVSRLPTLQQLRDRQERIGMDAPAGSRFNVSMQIAPNVAPAREMDAAAIAASIDQVNSALRAAAGLMRFAVPTMARAMFHGARDGVAVMADGSTRPLPVVGGAPNFTPSAFPGARTLRFGSAPDRVGIGPAARR